ncbi:MAG: glycosyltransferase family 39 protein [Candidatus Aminicenantes bacterium]|jgi:hypothetical protein
MTRKKIQIVLLLFISIFLLSLRMIHLPADPPVNLSASAGEYGDPGGYSYNARNKILFGQWELDDYNPMYISIIPHFVTFLSFKLFGVGIAQMNLVPVFFSVLVLILVFLIAWRWFGLNFGFLVFVFCGINYLFTMYSRVANRIMPMLFFLVLALFFFQMGRKDEKLYFLAGISSVLAYVNKGVCLYIVLALFLGFVIHAALNVRLKGGLLRIFCFLTGSAVTYILFRVFVYLPHKDMFQALSRINIPFLVPPRDLVKWLVHFWSRPSILFDNMPVISVLASLFFVMLLYRIVHKPKGLALLDWILVFWFIGGFSYYAIIYQRVTRHFIPQIIPLVFLAVMLLRDFFQANSITKPKKLKPVFGIFLFFWLLFPVSHLINTVLPSLPRFFSDIWTATAFLVAFCLLLVFLVYWVYRLWPENLKFSCSTSQKKAALALVLILIVFFSGKRYLAWAFHPEFKMKHVSEDLGELVENAAIAGLWAPVVCLENTHRAHESYPGYVNDEADFIEKLQITHVFATTFFGEDNYYWNTFPADMKRSRLLAQYHIWRGPVFLYDLHPGIGPFQMENFFEGELFTLPAGMPRYDPEASNSLAVRSENRKKGFIIEVAPENPTPKGRYKAVFRLKMEGPLRDSDRRVARIDVVSKTNKRVWAVDNILKTHFRSENKYQEFSLPVILNKTRNLQFRVYSDGLLTVWIDYVQLSETEGMKGN